jgi:AcrR family transcriptional regulator
MANNRSTSSREAASRTLTSARGEPSRTSTADGWVRVDGPGRMIEIQRARLLAAITEVSAERGVGDLSVARVVTRAGVSRRTFYDLFRDREDCFLAAFEDALGRARRHALSADDPGAGWAERLRSALTGLLSFLEVERGAGQLLIVGSLGGGAAVLECRKRVFAQIVAFIDQGRAEAKGGEPPPLTAEGIAGGVFSVLHSRLLDSQDGRLVELVGPLMSMIVLPYRGQAAARRELTLRVEPPMPRIAPAAGADSLRELHMRLTYRTVRVLAAVAAHPGGSNRGVADESGIADQGQISKLLARLHGLGLIENAGAAPARGAPNSWVLTDRGWEVHSALARHAS